MSEMFRTLRFYQTGYAKEQVDAFFARAKSSYEASDGSLGSGDVRKVSFRLRRGGYDPMAVDRALDRLETALASNERASAIETGGRKEWVAGLGEKARTLYPRLNRPKGQRFAAAGGGHVAYDTDDVDALCDRIIAYFDEGKPLTVEELRTVQFRRRVGKNGYSEGPVDAFIDRAIEVLLGVA